MYGIPDAIFGLCFFLIFMVFMYPNNHWTLQWKGCFTCIEGDASGYLGVGKIYHPMNPSWARHRYIS